MNPELSWQIIKGSFLTYQGKTVKVVENQGDTNLIENREGEKKAVHISELSPIELTEKWLINLGFSKKEKYWIKDLYAYWLEDKTLFLLYPGEPIQVHFAMRINAYHVHDLQQAISRHSELE